MTANGRPVVIAPGGGKKFAIAGDRFLRKGTGAEIPRAFSVIEYEGAPGGMGPPLHIHRGFEEAWYILDGEVAFSLNGGERRLTRGSYALVPRGAAHTFRVTSDVAARWVGIFSPGRYVGMIEELGRLLPSNGPPDPAKMRRLFARWDSVIVDEGRR